MPKSTPVSRANQAPNPAQATTEPKPVKSLDELIEILDMDALRNVIGGEMARPKGSVLE